VQHELRSALVVYAEKPPGSIYLIPVKLDECEIPDLQLPELGIRLRHIQWLDYWKDDGFDRLVEAINQAIKHAASSQAWEPARGAAREQRLKQEINHRLADLPSVQQTGPTCSGRRRRFEMENGPEIRPEMPEDSGRFG